MNNSAPVLPIPERADNVIDLASMRYLNEKAIRDYALRCSARFRANKFTRVGEDFIDEVKADVEASVRAMKKDAPTSLHEPLYTASVEDPPSFATGALMQKVETEVNGLIARIIQNKVQRQPTVGKTLGRTR